MLRSRTEEDLVLRTLVTVCKIIVRFDATKPMQHLLVSWEGPIDLEVSLCRLCTSLVILHKSEGLGLALKSIIQLSQYK